MITSINYIVLGDDHERKWNMNWTDKGSYIEIYPPKEFSFEECLVFLGRSDQEVLYKIEDGSIIKLIKIDESLVLCRIGYIDDSIRVEFLTEAPSEYSRREIAEYVWEWFDLNQDIGGFYQMAEMDGILKPLVRRYFGLRIICYPDLFEAIVWAILGQQINLLFAYTLKKRFVKLYGESLDFDGETFWAFPPFEKIASLESEDLRLLQFSTRKAEYIIGIAKAMADGELTKEALLALRSYEEVKRFLITLRGIGAWSADYVMMRSLHYTEAFPIADVGLHNALKVLLGLDRKPTIKEIEILARGWEGWQAYATFYLWRSLYDKE